MSEAIDLMFRLEHYADEPADPYWIEGESYCYQHAQAEKYKRRHENKKKPRKDRREILIDGGFSSEEDSCVHCHTCGKLLDYTLTDAGVASEFDHFRAQRFRAPLCRDAAFHIARMLCGGQDDQRIVEIARRAAAKIPATTDASPKGDGNG